MLFLSSGEERTGKEGEEGVITEGFMYGQSWTKEITPGGDSQTGLSRRGQQPGHCNEVIK